MPQGSRETQRFYDEQGWQRADGRLVDTDLFGVGDADGPVRQELHSIRLNRIRSAIQSQGDKVDLLECGCGGNPAQQLLSICKHYTGVDFSETGLTEAGKTLRAAGVPHVLLCADFCSLPFESDRFDAVYSAHALYHNADPAAQAASIAEMLRVLRPGGMLVLVLANPRPLFFWIRLAMRLLAESPMRPLLERIRAALGKKPQLPYNPQRIGWMVRELRKGATVRYMTYALPSTWVNQHLSEFHGIGRVVWRAIRWLHVHQPVLSARLGCYVTYVARKG